MNTDKLLKIPFTWVKRESILELLPNKTNVRFALFCAHQVKHLVKKEYQEVCLKAIEVAELFLEDRATKEECGKAADAAISAADAAAYAADAAASYAASYAAYAAKAAAYAANASAASASAASASAYAAAYAYTAANAVYAASEAVDAANTITQETIKQEQMNYLRDLIIAELPEEDKSCCWLLVAAL